MLSKEKTTVSLWARIKKIGLTVTIIITLLFSYSNHMDYEAFKKAVGPIGTNPLQLNPTKFITAELGAENLAVGNVSTDSMVFRNYTTKMLTRINKNDLLSGYATTASLSNYVTNSGLTTTLGGYVTSTGLTGTLSNYATISSLSSYVTNSSLTSTLSGYVPNTRTITINGTAFDLSANRTWTIPGTTYTAGSGLLLTGTVFSNTSPDQTITLTAGTGISISGTYPNFTITNTAPDVLPTINNSPGRSLNTNWTSGSRPATGFYSVTCTVTNPLLAGSSTVNAYLEYSTNGGSTWQTPNAQNGNSSAVGVAVAVAITNGQTVTLSAPLVQNVTYRIRTTTTGTASATLAAQSEINL